MDHALRSPMRLLAIKGGSNPDRPILGKRAMLDVSRRGRIHTGAVELFFVGTMAAKDQWYRQLAIAQPGPGYVHFCKSLPPEFFAGLASETRDMDAPGARWTRFGTRSESLDCTVSAIFGDCFLRFGR